MLFEYLGGWTPVAELLRSSIGQAIAQQHVTMDFARALPAAVELSTSGFAAYLTELIAQSK